MTFTYDGDPSATDVEFVRFYLQDTVSTAAIFTDEEISFEISEAGSKKAACVSLIDVILAKLNHEPDGRADWLQVDWRRSSENWMKLKDQLERRFGGGNKRTASARHVYRADSLADEAPDYD